MSRYLNAGFVLLALVLPATAHAQAETYGFANHSDGVTGYSGTCEGESAIVTNGSTTTVYHVITDAHGGWHLVTNATWRDPGTGESTGDSYLSMMTSHGVLNMTGGATTATTGGHAENLAAGAGDDSSQQAVYHTTTNANGDVTADITQYRFEECG